MRAGVRAVVFVREVGVTWIGGWRGGDVDISDVSFVHSV